MPIPADIIITNARVYTVDPTNPHADAVAISGRHIAFVGNVDAVKDWQGPETRVIDAQQKSLLPGFIDSHFHLLCGSLKLGDIQLDPVDSLDSLTTTVRTFAARHPDEPWLVGQGLRYSVMPPDQPLTRHHLDEIIADRPLILFAYDLHTAWTNTAALRRAELLDAGEPIAPNSEIVRDAAGQASGELRERGAYDPIMNLIPPPTEARQHQLLKQGLSQLAALGLTSVHNMDGDAAQLDLYAELEQAGELTLRAARLPNLTFIGLKSG